MNFNFLKKIIVLCTILSIPIVADVHLDQPVREIGYVGAEGIIETLNVTLSTKIGYRIKEEDLKSDINQLILSGFFQKVTPQTKSVENGIKLTFICTPYPKINNINIEGNTVFREKKLQKLMKNKKGNSLNIKYLKEDLMTLSEYYHIKGYDLFQIVSSEMKGDTLEIIVDEGHIEEIKWEGLNKIQEKLVNQKMTSKPKSVFNSFQLRSDRDNLIQTGYFRDVSAPFLQENATRTSIIVTFKVIEKKANRIDTGLELDMRDNTLVSFFRGNINHLLMHGDGLSGTIQFNIENTDISVKSHKVRYTQPWYIKGKSVDFAVDGWLREERERVSNTDDENLYNMKRFGGDISLTAPVINNRCYYTTSFKLEKIENDDLERISLEPYSVQSLDQTISYVQLDNQFNPRKGIYWTINVEKGWDMGLVKTEGIEFTRVGGTLAGFLPMTPSVVAGARIFAGIFRLNDHNRQTFEQEAYEIGGPNTLRGYRTNRSFIGYRELLCNLELRKDISEKKQIVLFLDLGKIFETGYGLSTEDIHTGYGIGVRFFTPIGPLRFDLAQGEQDTILHFSLGQLF